MVLPGIVAGSIFTFSLTLGDFITPLLIGGSNSNFIGNAIYDSAINGGDLPFAAALAFVSIAIMAVYLSSPGSPGLRGPMRLSGTAGGPLRVLAALVAFLLVRSAVIVLFAFDKLQRAVLPIHTGRPTGSRWRLTTRGS